MQEEGREVLEEGSCPRLGTELAVSLALLAGVRSTSRGALGSLLWRF